MTEPMTPDRLADIRANWAERDGFQLGDDVHDLLGEVDRLRAELADVTDTPIMVRPEGTFFEPDVDGEISDAVVACSTPHGHPVAVLLTREDRARLGRQCAPGTESEVDRLRARVAELEAVELPDDDEMVRCAALHCPNGERFAKAEERGWAPAHMGTWLCPQHREPGTVKRV